MTPADAARVLSFAAAYDKRTIGEADARTWAADLDTIDLHEAIAAVREHYRTCPDAWLRPGHIVAIVRRHRRIRLDRGWSAEAAALHGLDPNDVDGYLTALRRTRHTSAATDAADVRRLPPGRFDGTTAQQRRNAHGRALCDQALNQPDEDGGTAS
jgi:hypothetical protein